MLKWDLLETNQILEFCIVMIRMKIKCRTKVYSISMKIIPKTSVYMDRLSRGKLGQNQCV